MRRTIALAVLALALSAGRTAGQLVVASTSPGNSVVTGAGPWFSGTATGVVICAGTNASLSCPFGTQTGVGKVTAHIALQNKGLACTYMLSVVDGTGPVGISTLLTATFASSATTASALAARAVDTIDVVLKLKGNTPAGSYSGTIVLADSVSGQNVAIPVSFTR